MKSDGSGRFAAVLTSAVLAALLTLLSAHVLGGMARPATLPATSQQATPPASAQEIPASQTIGPDQLANELARKDKPIVVCVAPRFLYDGAHIPGALFHGATSTDKGLADFKQWAASTAKDRNIVLYCGCCPITRCPNVRPALATLHELGFTNVKVLWLPQDFHTDWIQKGYPTEKSQ
ncbi:MAG TPA: rhodanese-like domain-containing protein [Candidatus Acidoferrales bacterium]|nr:rhodanese-like domain-containing protein [Candidatus Acidoferrales bacterium]